MAVHAIRIINASEPSKAYIVPLNVPDRPPETGMTIAAPGNAVGAAFHADGTFAFWATPPSRPVQGLSLAPQGQQPPVSGEPRETYNITPVAEFYVADGAYVSETIIDMPEPSTNFAAIDLTETPRIIATIILAADGGFTVHYS